MSTKSCNSSQKRKKVSLHFLSSSLPLFPDSCWVPLLMFKSRDKALLNLALNVHIFKAAPSFPQTRQGSKIMTEEGSRGSSRLDVGPQEPAPSLQESKDNEQPRGQSASHTSQQGAIGWMASLHLTIPLLVIQSWARQGLSNTARLPTPNWASQKATLPQCLPVSRRPPPQIWRKLLCLLDQFVTCRTF